MGTLKTPQEKKRLSYQFDRRDDYREGNKSSRKGIRWRKRWVNQTYRHHIKRILRAPIDQTNADTVENQLFETRRPLWRKSPHQPLGLYLYERGKVDLAKVKNLTFRVHDEGPLFGSNRYD